MAYKFHSGLLVLYHVWRILVVSVDLGINGTVIIYSCSAILNSVGFFFLFSSLKKSKLSLSLIVSKARVKNRTDAVQRLCHSFLGWK